MNDKTKIAASNAFEIILKSGRKPYKLLTDGGGEFYSHYFRNMLKKHDIELYSMHSDLKAIMVEPFNQTLLNTISKMIAARSSYRYIDDSDNIMNKYNNSYHSSFKMTPSKASKEENVGLVYFNLYNDKRRKLLQSKSGLNLRKGIMYVFIHIKNHLRKDICQTGVKKSMLYIKTIIRCLTRIK